MDAPLHPKARERLVAARLSETLAGEGLEAVKCAWPAWGRPDNGNEWLLVSVQADSKATDEWAGGRFRVEWEKSPSGKPSGGLLGRALFFQLLALDELRTVLAQENRVRSSLPTPPPEHAAVYPAGAVRDMYLSYFEPQTAFDAVRCWLSCRTAEHAEGWVTTLAPLLPVMAERAHRLLNSGTRHLGSGSLLSG